MTWMRLDVAVSRAPSALASNAIKMLSQSNVT